MLACVMSQQSLFVFPSKFTFCVGAGIGSTLGEDFVDPLLEVFHHQVILLLPVLVLRLWLKATQLACVGRAKAIGILGESLDVQHPADCFSS